MSNSSIFWGKGVIVFITGVTSLPRSVVAQLEYKRIVSMDKGNIALVIVSNPPQVGIGISIIRIQLNGFLIHLDAFGGVALVIVF